MTVEGFVNRNDRQPERGHKYVDEEQGSNGAQHHEGQHGRSGRRWGATRRGLRRWEEELEWKTRDTRLPPRLFLLGENERPTGFYYVIDYLIVVLVIFDRRPSHLPPCPDRYPARPWLQ